MIGDSVAVKAPIRAIKFTGNNPDTLIWGTFIDLSLH